MVAVCTGVYHLSKRTTAGLLADLFGVDLAVGTVSACEQTVSAAVAAPVAAAQAYMQQQAVVHVDETGWREGRQRAWLWVVVTTLATVFLVHARRGTVAARALLGEYGGRLVSDRWSAYNAWPARAPAAVLGAFAARVHGLHRARGDGPIGSGGPSWPQTQAMFAAWHRVRDGTLSRAQFQTATSAAAPPTG